MRRFPVWLVLCAAWLGVLVGCAGTEKPSPPVPPQPPAHRPVNYRYRAYFVKKGDTLVSVGRAFGVPWEKILEENPGLPGRLREGQVLLIPLHWGSPGAEPPRHTAAPQPPKGLPREALHRGKPSHPFWWPTAGALSRRYGDVVRGLSEPGIGIRAPAGTEVRAVAGGTVICVVTVPPGSKRGWGNVVVIEHPGGIVSWYGQLGRITVKTGQKVQKGELIGTVGSSGASGEPELALRFFKDERPIDPLPYLP